jgi:predicted glycogen debranching enzyme
MRAEAKESVLTSAPLGREICCEFEQALQREWLITNGLGGFGAGTVAGCQTRRYHGLLIAARTPPTGRALFLVDVDVTARVGGRDYELACHEYGGGVVRPDGYRLIESFRLEGTVPAWTYALGPARLTRRLFMAHGQNTVYVHFTLERGDEPVRLLLRPLCTARDYHWHRRGGEGFAIEPIEDGCRVVASGSEHRLSITADCGAFRPAPDYHWNLLHRQEAERGLDAIEDLFAPGVFELELEPGGVASLTATIGTQAAGAAAALTALRMREAALLESLSGEHPDWIHRLVLAADQFIVARSGSVAGDGSRPAAGTTVIAGYPWFADWGRDTMIALPGLALATGRAGVAAQILRTFARHVDRGMVPNRFPDDGDTPEYNTADATLWYFVALQTYVQATHDLELARELLPTLLDIESWHRRGTRHGIVVDPDDGLLRAGEPGQQLTWMDAKVGGWVVTPRIGKPVEINALWCNALQIIAALAERLGDWRLAMDFRNAGRNATASFQHRFWYAEGGYLYDVIDGPEHQPPDASLRPNQLLALALPHAVLDSARARRVLEVCERELLTSYGLRTLEPGDRAYVGRYGGDQWQRDGAYHQGTVWPWLLGLFARAHLALHGDRQRAATYLAPLEQHLADACIGQISEIFDGDAPHRPRGCFAQAWSVAEILRAWVEIHGSPPGESP